MALLPAIAPGLACAQTAPQAQQSLPQPLVPQPAVPQSPVAQSPVPQQKSMIIQVAPAVAEPVPPPAVVLAPPAEPAPPTRENPGLFNELGKMFKDTPSLMPSWTAPSWSLPTLGATSLNTVVKGRMQCPVAANGAPDCKTASDRLCQSKGYKEGKSLDTDAAQTCSAKVMIPGRKQQEGDCRTDNYVVQAVCN